MGIKLRFAMYAFAMAILFYWPVVYGLGDSTVNWTMFAMGLLSLLLPAAVPTKQRSSRRSVAVEDSDDDEVNAVSSDVAKDNILPQTVRRERQLPAKFRDESVDLGLNFKSPSKKAGSSRASVSGKRYAVEAVVGRQVMNGETRYHVKWQGYPASQNTWEPYGNIKDFAHLIRAFEAAASPQPRAKLAAASPSPAKPAAKATRGSKRAAPAASPAASPEKKAKKTPAKAPARSSRSSIAPAAASPAKKPASPIAKSPKATRSRAAKATPAKAASPPAKKPAAKKAASPARGAFSSPVGSRLRRRSTRA